MAGIENAAKALYTLLEKQRPKHLNSEDAFKRIDQGGEG